MNRAATAIDFNAQTFIASLRAKAQSVRTMRRVLYEKLGVLPRHMAVEPELYELILLMLADVEETHNAVVGHDLIAQFLVQPATIPSPVSPKVRAILARAEQKIKGCDELLCLVQKMIYGELDISGNQIREPARWSK